MRYIVALLCSFLTVQALAQDSKIKGKGQVPSGRQVVLDIGHIPGDIRIWALVNPPGDGEDGPNVPFVTEDGKKAVFATTVPGVYYFAASVGGLDEGQMVKLQQLIHVLTVGDPVDPQPKPVKPLPEGKYGLANFVRGQAIEQRVPKDISKIAALAYRSAAGKIQDKSITDPTKAYEAVNDQLTDSLDDDQLDILDKVTASLVKKLDSLAKEGKIKTVDDQMQTFNEVALGLENVP